MIAAYHERFDGISKHNGTIKDLGEVIGGATPSKKNRLFFTDKGTSWITPRDLAGISRVFISHGATDITDAGYSSCSTKLMPKGSVLFSSRAPVGYVAISSNAVCTNQGFKSVVPKKAIGTAYLYCFLKENAAAIESSGSGTTFVEVSGRVMKGFPTYVPDEPECMAFSAVANPLLDLIACNEKQMDQLVQIRDSLLPKLMSGEIDVTQAKLPMQPNSHLCCMTTAQCLSRLSWRHQ